MTIGGESVTALQLVQSAQVKYEQPASCFLFNCFLMYRVILFQWVIFLHCQFVSLLVVFFFSVCAEVENAKRGLQGGQAYNISTIHPKWNPLSHSQCHPLC